MAREHWFDDVCKTMHGISRRDIARAGAMLLPGLLLGGLTVPTVAGKKGKGNGKKPNKPNKPNKPKPPAGSEICGTTWPGKGQEARDNRASCRRTIERCKRKGNGPFCILEGDPVNPAKVADCCQEGESCCGEECCAKDRHCCDGKACCAKGYTCCGNSCAPANDPDIKCCDGKRYDTRIASEHCGACGNACGIDEMCSDGQCLCVGSNCPLPCQDRDCPPAQQCITSRGYYCSGQSSPDCQCGCGPGLKYCDYPQVGWACVSENSDDC